MRPRPLRLLLALLAVPASAQAPDSTLDAVTVTAAREAVATARAPARVTVLDRAALADARDLADALAARTPVHVRRYGPSGLASLSVRGSGASQALVLLDGQRLSDPALGQVDVALLPTALLESVEVLSGPASGLYGSDAVGGVVHLRPATGGLRVATEAGPWGGRTASGLASARLGRARGTVAADLARAEDDYTVADRGLPGAPRVARAGWDSERATAWASLRADDGPTTGGLGVWLATAERGLGGSADGDRLVGARQWDRRARLSADAAHQTGPLRLSASAHVQRASVRYASPFPAARPDAIDDTGRTATAGLDLRADAERWGGVWSLGLTASTGAAEHPGLAEAARDRALGLALSARQPVGAVTLFPALRADLYAPAGGGRQLGLAPQVGLNARLGGAVRAKASAGRAFRMPTLNDRYWTPGGNLGLRPETAWNAEGGVVWQRRGVQAEATAYATTARDQIVWAPTGRGYWAPENVARTRALGLEASARAARVVTVMEHRGLVDSGLLGTLTEARDLDRGDRLRYVPRWTAKGWAGLTAGALRLGLDAQAVGARPTTLGGGQPLGAHVVVGARVGVRRELGGALLGLDVSLDNLTDARYETVRSHVMPPRHARLRFFVQAR